MISIVFVLTLLLFPLPGLQLLGVMSQRRKLRQERAQFAYLKRIANGGRIGRRF